MDCIKSIMSHNEYRDNKDYYEPQVEFDSDENNYPFVRDEEYDLADRYNLTETCDFCNGKAEFDLNDKDNCKTCLKDLAEQTELEFIKDEGRMPTDEEMTPTPEYKKWFDENVIPDSSDDEVDILLDKLPELPKEAVAEMNKLFNVK